MEISLFYCSYKLSKYSDALVCLQLLCQVLNRVSSQAGCFQHVVMLDIPDLETVDHFPILAAVVGILLAVLHEEIQKFDG